ncbi:MAG: hypothetical protein K0R38_2449 [Polyangiaceae bacterium]|nr:hypothetical protein [Polyangiaceae bacterium]
MKRFSTALLLGLLHGWPRPTLAQTETRAAVAEALYRQARDLMAAGKYAEACPKFAESQRLDPATGTLLNLASCHERQGRLATAWLEYADVIAAARRDAREDRVQYASERMAELEPKLSRLTLRLSPDADAPGLDIELDGAKVGRAVIGAPTPVDPGTHTVQISAPGKKPLALSVEVGAVADQKTLNIPRLEDAPTEPAAAVPSSPLLTTSTVTAPSDQATTRPIPTSVYLAGGITLALAAGAGATGLAYLNKRDDYNASKTEERQDAALTYSYVNLGLWVGAAIGAGVTTYLYVTRPTERVSVRVTPLVAPQLAGLSFQGGF